MFDFKTDFYKLVQNGWLTKEEADTFINDESIIERINKCTSPQPENIFKALKSVSLDKVKVLILGKDPYPNPKDAHGLAFSSLNTTTPDSLKNIFKAIDEVYGSTLFKDEYNNLTNWVNQGVLLLNTGLTYQRVEDDTLSTKDKNNLQNKIQKDNMKVWKPFIKLILQKILTIKNRPIVMMLWGNDAHDIVFSNIKDSSFKTCLHDTKPHIIPNTSILILQCAHPSPLSVNRGGNFPILAPEQFRDCDKHLGENKIHWTNLK